MKRTHFSMVPVAAIRDRNLPSAALRTLAAIAAYAGEDGYCFPKLERIAFDLGVARSTVQGHVTQLESLGYLGVERHQRPGGGRTRSGFTIRYPAPSMRVIAASQIRDPVRKSHNLDGTTDVGISDIAMSKNDVGNPDIYKEQTLLKRTEARTRALRDFERGSQEGQWRARLTGFARSRLWLSEWGDAPDRAEGDNQVPHDLLIEFGFRKGAA